MFFLSEQNFEIFPVNSLVTKSGRQKQVGKIYEDRKKMTKGELPINWGYAEVLAYATLADSGVNIRFTGEDIQRGTFAHRHAVVHDFKTGDL